jgi:hypothetical protein
MRKSFLGSRMFITLTIRRAMKDSDKQIQDGQEKVKTTFEQKGQMEKFLHETMDNFYYRYLETTESKGMKTEKIAENMWGAQSFESNMADALKNPNPNIKPFVMELAKRIPKAQKPLVRYTLAAIHGSLAEKGNFLLLSEVSWDFPTFGDPSKCFQTKKTFVYEDLTTFRKGLALALEDVCSIFVS